MLKLLVENDDVKLCYDPKEVNKFKVFKKVPMGTSEELDFSHLLAQSSVFSKSLKSYFTKFQVDTALARLHALKYARRRYKV